MAPRRRQKPLPVDLPTISSDLNKIASQLAGVTNVTNWPTDLLDESEGYAAHIEQSADQILKHVRKLIKATQRQRRAPSEPRKEQDLQRQKRPSLSLRPRKHPYPSMRQAPESDGCYVGEVKFGMAQLKQQTVSTVFEMVDDFPQCEELGYCKVAVGKDVTCNMNLEKISGSTIDMLDDWQSKTVYLSPRKKRDKLHGLICHSYIKRERKHSSDYSRFHVPDLSWKDSGEDPRELFRSTVKDARKDDKQPYLVIPTESSSRWLESVGISPELLDCGEELKKTAERIPGVHTPYFYVSAKRGSSSPLHVEDAFLGSINIVLAGAPKVWLMVEPYYREELEAKARQYLEEEEEDEGEGDDTEGDDDDGDDGDDDDEDDDDDDDDNDGDDDTNEDQDVNGEQVENKDEDEDDEDDDEGPCSQFVRHLSDLLSPELLDFWKIPYRIVACKAGEMIITFPETYHQVVNAGPNLAVAINFAADTHWTGPPKSYRFCGTKCTRFAITRAKFRMRWANCDDTKHGSAEEEACDKLEIPPNRSSPNGSSHQHQDNLDLPEEEVEEAIDAHIKGMADHVSSGSGPIPEPLTAGPPPTPGNPDGFNLPTPQPSSITSEPDEQHQDAPAPHALPITPGKPEVSPCQTPTLPTTVSETETQQHGGEAGQENSNPMSQVTIPDDDNKLEDIVELPVYEPPPTLAAASTLETKLSTLIQQTLQFIPALRVSESTIESFRLGGRLNDDAIALALGKILPEPVEPLIASFAIQNKPESSMSHRYIRPDIPQSELPFLLHSKESTHLCIACSVKFNSLEFDWGSSGDHWILVVVDFRAAKIHVFGNDGGRKTETDAIAYNIGLFVNNYRCNTKRAPIAWSDPETYPLYPTGYPPDGYNCGIAVISRAEAFIYQQKALKASVSTDLSNELDKRRAVYLESIYLRCRSVYDDEKERYHLTPESRKRKIAPHILEGKPPKLRITAAQLSQRTAQFPPLAGIPESEAEQWGHCLTRAAEKGGFNPQGILEAFKRAPRGQPLPKVVKVLQYICEVASAEILLQIKQLFLKPKEDDGNLENADDQDIVDLHIQIKSFGNVSLMAQAQKFKSQLLYRDWFERKKNGMRRFISQKEDADESSDKSTENTCLQITQPASDNGLTMENQLRRDVARLIASRENLDEGTVRVELNEYLRKAEVLHSLLHPHDGGERRQLSFLFLLPLYECPYRPPLLNVMECEPPVRANKFYKIESKDLLGLNKELASFFGGSLSIARPELHQIESYLPREGLEHQTGQILPGNSTNHSGPLYLVTASDKEIRETKPRDVARLLKPIDSPVERFRLEFREERRS